MRAGSASLAIYEALRGDERGRGRPCDQSFRRVPMAVRRGRSAAIQTLGVRNFPSSTGSGPASWSTGVLAGSMSPR